MNLFVHDNELRISGSTYYYGRSGYGGSLGGDLLFSDNNGLVGFSLWSSYGGIPSSEFHVGVSE